MTEPVSPAENGLRPSRRPEALSDPDGGDLTPHRSGAMPMRSDGEVDRVARSVVGQLQRTVDQLDRTADTLLETAADLREARPRARFHLVGWLLVLALAPILTLLGVSAMPDDWKLRAVAAVMGVDDGWTAGSLVLFKSNPAAYDSLMVGYQLAADNLAVLRDCQALADARGEAVACSLVVQPPAGR